jgi:hypothetical protein
LFGLRSRTVTARSAATAAENRPVYSVPIFAQSSIDVNMSTHNDEDPISIFLPAFNHLPILLLCDFGVYGKKWSRAITEAGFSLQ